MLVVLGILCLTLVWLALVWWTRLDARLRFHDGRPATCATAASVLLPVLGTILYMILRPPQYLDDIEDRALSIRASRTTIRVLVRLEKQQAEMQASVQRLEEALQVNRQVAAAVRDRPAEPGNREEMHGHERLAAPREASQSG